MSRTLASEYDLVIFDLDGVVYLGEEAIPGAARAVSATVEGGTPVAFVTNNASRSAQEVAQLLRSLSVRADAAEVLTSGQAAAAVLAETLPTAAAVLVVGAPALREEIRAVGLLPVSSAAERPVALVQGYGPGVGWSDLAEACVAVRAGAQWVVTNADMTLPSPRGPLPGNGSLVAVVSAVLGGRQPDLVVGKPSPTLFEVTARRRGAERALVVGDRLDTDIEGAGRAGMDSLLVLTGVSTAADVLAAAVHARPTYLGADATALSTPAEAVRVPTWPDGSPPDGSVRAGAWRVRRDGDLLVLVEDGRGDRRPADALRALAAAAWAYPAWTVIAAESGAAAEAIDKLGLTRFAAWPISPASAASADQRSSR